MKKPGKKAIAEQMEILNTIQGKGPVDWVVYMVLFNWRDLQNNLPVFSGDATREEVQAGTRAWLWLQGDTTETPVEYLGYAELPEPPVKYKRALYIAIAMIVTGIVGLLVTR